MARRGNVGYKRNTRNRDQLDGNGLDDSDEDYKVGEDEEINESEDEYCSSFAEAESEESLGEFGEEEEGEWVEKKVKSVERPRGQKGFQGKKKNGGLKRKRKRVVVYSDEEEDDDSDNDFASTKGRKKKRVSYKEEEEEEDVIEVLYRESDGRQRPIKKTMVSYKEDNDDFDDEISRKNTKFSDKEEKDNMAYDDSDDDDVDDDDDDDFLPDEVDGIEDNDDFDDEISRKKIKFSDKEKKDNVAYDDSDDDDDDFLPGEIDGIGDEESPVTTKSKMGRASMEEKGNVTGRRKSRNAKVMKKTKRKRSIRKQGSRRKVRSDCGKEFRDDNRTVQKKITAWGRSRRKSALNSDSDFVSPGSSDHEYTISEDEREQIREASEFCRSLRSSNSKLIEENFILPPQRKRAVRKGKGKVEGIEVDAGKQVCGICLSEEGKRTVRGTLNCCSHYFCFACIIEWSKVESRCPLCKQRFSTISRTARADAGLGLRTQVIIVPERDQVYQPSEEERRGYLDPYENVLCIECQQGGDDALMLLCDLCDSPAHTYCVGLGREVPEGNWYCDGCRPTALASSGAQGLNPNVDHGASNNLSVDVSSARGTFDLNELYVPDTPLTQGTEHSSSPRHSLGNFQAASPASGTGAATVLERRRIQRQIYQFLNYRSRPSDRTDGMVTVSGNGPFGAQLGGGRELVPGYAVTPMRMAPRNIYLQRSLLDNTTLPFHPREVFSPRFSNLRGQSLHNQASTSADHSLGGTTLNEFIGINRRVGLGQGHQELHPCSGTSEISTDVSIPNQFREVGNSLIEKDSSPSGRCKDLYTPHFS